MSHPSPLHSSSPSWPFSPTSFSFCPHFLSCVGILCHGPTASSLLLTILCLLPVSLVKFNLEEWLNGTIGIKGLATGGKLLSIGRIRPIFSSTCQTFEPYIGVFQKLTFSILIFCDKIYIFSAVCSNYLNGNSLQNTEDQTGGCYSDEGRILVGSTKPFYIRPIMRLIFSRLGQRVLLAFEAASLLRPAHSESGWPG